MENGKGGVAGKIMLVKTRIGTGRTKALEQEQIGTSPTIAPHGGTEDTELWKCKMQNEELRNSLNRRGIWQCQELTSQPLTARHSCGDQSITQ
jgi:hypothetical protein